MRIRIAICDDLYDCLRSLQEYTHRYLKENAPDLQYDMDVFSHPDDLLIACEKQNYNLFILDIIMPMINGIQVARTVQKEHSAAFFIFCTSSREFPMDAYSVNAIHYLTKPIRYPDFEVAMNRFFLRLGNAVRIPLLIPDSAGHVSEFSLREFLYISVSGKTCVIHTLSGEKIPVRSSIRKLAEDLSGYSMIFRLGSSYIINLEAVRKIDSTSICMKNRDVIYIPRGAAGEARRKYMEYFDLNL